MPRLIVDARPLTNNPKGVGRYAYHLCRQLSDRLPQDWDMDILVCSNELPIFPAGFPGRFVAIPRVSDLLGGYYIVPRMIKLLKADILLKVNESARGNYNVPVVTVCHDIPALITHAQESQGMVRSAYRKMVDHLKAASVGYGLRSSAWVICNSDFIRKSIHSYYGIPTSRTVVGYCGIDPRFYFADSINKREVLQRYGIDRYILTFATGDYRENFLRLPDVIALLRQFGSDVPVLIAGVRREESYCDGLVYHMRRLDLVEGKDYIIESFLGEGRFNDLMALYATADFYLELSLHEGFGMQLAEAMACGTTCITSEMGALKEVGGEYGIFIANPLDNLSIVRTIKRAYQEGMHDRDNAQQVDYTKRFSWNNTGQVVVECLLHAMSAVR